MRRRYLVSYDIADPARLRRIYRLMRGYGDHLQLSVFSCDLSPRDLAELEARLADLIHHDQDQVLFANLGPADHRGQRAVHALGRRYRHPERLAVIL